MSLDTQMIALILFFSGVGMTMWRVPQADRWHLVLCVAALGLWVTLAVLLPPLRTPGYLVTASGFVAFGLLRYLGRDFNLVGEVEASIDRGNDFWDNRR
jgi:hypothetical protein